jgi:hypothetical protein
MRRLVPKNPKVQQWLWFTGGGLTIAIAIAMVVYPGYHRYTFFDDIAGYLAGLVGFAGILMINRARKYFLKSADELLSMEKRPPVIYLRSFKDDKKAAAPAALTNWLVLYTEEEQLVHVLNDFGPCVAIGQPGEQLPDLGAPRMYLADDEWQDKVKEFLVKSKLVVLRAGTTPNFFWEVEQSAKTVRPENLIILVPMTGKQYNQFRDRANQYFSKPLPHYVGSFILSRRAGTMQGYIYFEKDWEPHFVKFEIPLIVQSISRPLEPVIRKSFAPVYQQLNMPIPETRTSPVVVIMIIISLALMCWAFFPR